MSEFWILLGNAFDLNFEELARNSDDWGRECKEDFR